MKILLTGEPHVGKSTLLNKVITGVRDKHGFVTNEVTKDGERTGFELVSSNGKNAVLASIDSKSDIRVSKYGVSVDRLDNLLTGLGDPNPRSLIYIDEIGQMELYSEYFKEVTKEYLAKSNPFIGTLTSAYTDTFTKYLRSRNDIEIIHITFENRDDITAEVKSRVAKCVH